MPLWAERVRHDAAGIPHHIAERYGLFTIIVLGECVLAATVAVQAALDAADGVAPRCSASAAAGLVLVFALWWLYFLEPAGDGLRSAGATAFVWGYGHYVVFAAARRARRRPRGRRRGGQPPGGRV